MIRGGTPLEESAPMIALLAVASLTATLAVFVGTLRLGRAG